MAMGGDSTSTPEESASGAIATEEHKAQQEKQDEQEWEDIDSDDEDTFFLDPEGRVPFAGKVAFGFRSAPRALAAALSEPGVLTRVVADCQTVFSARAKKLEYSTGETFWVSANAEPRNCLETLALDIFRAHTGDARFNRATSGAEWWTQVIDDTDDIGWHWDKDYGMEARGINVHPCLATVTYLSANGGPTVILEKKGPMACEDVDGVSGEAEVAWISRPQLGKHICFDGRYLHAAPADLALPLAEEQRQTCLSSSAVAAAVAGEHDSGTASTPMTTTTAATTTAAAPALPEPVPPAAASEAGPAAAATVVGTKRSNGGEPKAGVFNSNGAPSSVAQSAARDKAPPQPTVMASAAMETGGSNNSNSNSSGISSSASGVGGSGSGSGSRRRVTFLVNVWLNHTPKTASRLPDATAAALSSTRLAANLTDDGFVPSGVLRVNQPEAFLAANSAAGGGGGSGEGRGSGSGGAACDPDSRGETDASFGLGGVADSAGAGGDAGGEERPCGVADKSVSEGAGRGEGGVVVPVADMRWRFGEVGDEAEEQVHLRYEVLVPVPVGLLQSPTHTPSTVVAVGMGEAVGAVGAGGSVGARGDSFRVEYWGGRRPRVTRVGGGESSSEGDSESGSGSGSESGSGSGSESGSDEEEYGEEDE